MGRGGWDCAGHALLAGRLLLPVGTAVCGGRCALSGLAALPRGGRRGPPRVPGAAPWQGLRPVAGGVSCTGTLLLALPSATTAAYLAILCRAGLATLCRTCRPSCGGGGAGHERAGGRAPRGLGWRRLVVGGWG